MKKVRKDNFVVMNYYGLHNLSHNKSLFAGQDLRLAKVKKNLNFVEFFRPSNYYPFENATTNQSKSIILLRWVFL